MDLRITKPRLNNHLSYDWWKYIALLLAGIIFWNLVFTMASPRLTPGEKLDFKIVAVNFEQERGYNAFSDIKRLLGAKYVKAGTEPEILEVGQNVYYPSDSNSMLAFNTHTSADEGDIFIIAYGAGNLDIFASYADGFLMADFQTVIAGAKEFYEERYADIDAFKAANPKIKEQNLEREFLRDTVRRQGAYDNAVKLEGYINDPELDRLFRRYQKFRFSLEKDPSLSDQVELGENLVWGLNLDAFDNMFDSKIGLFSQPHESNEYKKLALGITFLKKQNMPLYYENLEVVNYFIEVYHLGLTPEA